MRNRGPQPKPKGGINTFLAAYGLLWSKTQIVWDRYSPRVRLPPSRIRGVQREQRVLQRRLPASAGWIRIPAPGSVTKGDSLRSSRSSDQRGRNDATPGHQKGFFGMGLVPSGPRYATGAAIVARDRREWEGDTAHVSLIFIAYRFHFGPVLEIRRRGPEPGLRQCVILSQPSTCWSAVTVRLRRRVEHRRGRRSSYARLPGTRARKSSRREAQARWRARSLNERVAGWKPRKPRRDHKQIMAAVSKPEPPLRDVSDHRIGETSRSASKEEMESQVRRIQSGIKSLAGLLPPVPVFVMGVLIFMRRQRREREAAAAVRRLRG
jgi:hypothetical protein